MFREIAAKNDFTSLDLFNMYPSASDRAGWEAVGAGYRKELAKEGEKWLGYEFSPIYATDYMEFCRTGNRSRFEEKLFKRRSVRNIRGGDWDDFRMAFKKAVQ